MLIYQTTDDIDRETCLEVIQKFKSDIGNTDGSLYISDKESWKEIDTKIYQKVNVDFGCYLEQLVSYNPRLTPLRAGHKVSDSGYIIREITDDRWSEWYDDCHIDPSSGRQRVAGFIYYLNSAEHGAELEFADGKTFHSSTGHGIFFPATWTNIHRIKPGVNDPVVVLMGWFYQTIDPVDAPSDAN